MSRSTSSIVDRTRMTTVQRDPGEATNRTPRAVSPWWWLSVIIPLLAAMALVLLGNEWIAARQIRQHVQSKRASGLPVDDETLAAQFFSATSQDHTVEWNELLFLAGRQWSRSTELWDHATFNAFKSPEAVGQPLPDIEIHRQYLTEIRPLIDRVQQLSQHPETAWLPVVFEGIRTQLYRFDETRSLHALLTHEFLYALQADELDRALQALRIDRSVTESFDWKWCMMVDIMTMNFQLNQHRLIRHSLAVDPWSEKQLSVIADLVGPPTDLPARWRSVIAGEQAMALEELEADSGALFTYVEERFFSSREPEWLIVPATQKLQIIRNMQHDGSLGDDGYEGLRNRVTQATQSVDDSPTIFSRMLDRRYRNSKWRTLLNHYRDRILGYATACERLENSRRLTVTALAIKQFQLQHDAWPSELSELTEFGIARQDWIQVNGALLTYEQHPDGDHVTLTNYELPADSRTCEIR